MTIVLLVISLLLSTLGASPQKSLYGRLDPTSISQALAFYELYPESEEGKSALERVTALLKVQEDFSTSDLTYAVNRFSTGVLFSEKELQLIEKLAAHLPTRSLKGATILSEKEMLELPSEEMDLGRALLLSQLDGEKECLDQVRNYSAILDLMALSVLARVDFESPPEQKIRELNRFIFDENRFRFPPQSIYAKEIDLYTFLPSVMDNHLGVCLGVTTLYIALAERIKLPLEIITPPGHIYLRYRDKEKQINIETTARGIDMPDEKYLSVHLKSLPLRTKKEVVGMTHVNKASTYLYRGEFEKAAGSYKKALPYMKDDLLVKELLGLSLLLTGHKEEALPFLKDVKEASKHEGVAAHEDVVHDYFAGVVDEEGIRSIFMEVDEKKSSILEKQKELLKVMEKYPKFRAGIEQLAVSYIQLNRYKEGLVWLEKYHALDPSNPTIEYYLAVIHGERSDFASCWKYLKNAEKITRDRGYSPKALKDLRKELQTLSPEKKQ